MKDRVMEFLRGVGEEGLLMVEVEGAPVRARRLADLFAACPMCGGTTDVDFDVGRAVCGVCAQEWDLRGNPVPGRMGNKDVWRRRQRIVKERGNGHKYGFDPPVNLEEVIGAKI